MNKPTDMTINRGGDLGINRTGIGTSPNEAKKTADGARAAVPQPLVEAEPLTPIRDAYSKEAEPLGTVPPPVSVKGAGKAMLKALQGKKATVLLDQLAERIAFERTGVRLYEALLAKYDASEVHEGDPAREELERIRDEELAHFAMLCDAMEKMGGDPTAVTPSADVAAVTSMGLLQVLTDPRTTFTEGLKAILVAELADNDAWLVLSDLAEAMGQDQLAANFRRALTQEEDHLARVRSWLLTAVQGQAGVSTQVPAGPPPASTPAS